MTRARLGYGCGQCGAEDVLCDHCHNCEKHCNCGVALFDADELGLDTETDNTPEEASRHA